jgi:hypothetical protein
MVLFREWGDKQGLAFCLGNLGLVAIIQGDLVRAAKLTEEAVTLFRELGSRGDVSISLNNLGWIAFLRNDLGRAVHPYKQSLTLGWETGMYTVVLDDLEGFACLAGAQGDGVRAAQLCGAAEALYEATGYPRDPTSHAEMEPYFASGRSQIHEAVWAKRGKRGGRWRSRRPSPMHWSSRRAVDSALSLRTSENNYSVCKLWRKYAPLGKE